MKGSTYKRCAHGQSGTPGRPACRQSHGSWWWRAEGERDAATGRRRQPAQGGYATKDEAGQALAAYVTARQSGTWADDKRRTVASWLTSWLEENAERLEPKTLAGYRSHVERVLIPHLGRYRLRDLRRQHVEAMIRELAKPIVIGPATARSGRQVEQRSRGTLDSYRRTLRAALAAAVRRGLVATNVAEGRIDALPKGGKRAPTWWQPEQVAAFLTSVSGDRLAALYEVAAFAGLRRGELLGLRWEDVDLTGDQPGVTVRQALSGLAGRHRCPVCGGEHVGRRFKLPKTDAGTRWVPLVGATVRELLAHQAAQAAERSAWGEAYSDHGLVFAQEDGVPLGPDAISKRFDHLASAAGLPRIRLHDQRHGACSLLLAAGVPVETVAMILGHASPAVTRSVYAHVLREPASQGMRAAAALVRADDRAQSVHSAGSSDAPDEGVEP